MRSTLLLWAALTSAALADPVVFSFQSNLVDLFPHPLWIPAGTSAGDLVDIRFTLDNGFPVGVGQPNLWGSSDFVQLDISVGGVYTVHSADIGSGSSSFQYDPTNQVIVTIPNDWGSNTTNNTQVIATWGTVWGHDTAEMGWYTGSSWIWDSGSGSSHVSFVHNLHTPSNWSISFPTPPPPPDDEPSISYLPGDANQDTFFDSADLLLVFAAGQFEDNLVQNSSWSTGDWNKDLEFDSSDLILAFQTNVYEGRVPLPVPEPSAISTLWGLLLLAWRKR